MKIRTEYRDGRYWMSQHAADDVRSCMEISRVEWALYRACCKLSSAWQRRLQRLDNAQWVQDHPEEA